MQRGFSQCYRAIVASTTSTNNLLMIDFIDHGKVSATMAGLTFVTAINVIASLTTHDCRAGTVLPNMTIHATL